MKLVSDKPTKSFRLLGFLSLSFSFSLSFSLSFFSCLLLPYSLSFSIFLFTSIRTFLLDPFPFPLPSPYSSISAFLQIFSFFFFFANYNRGEEKRERKKGKEWHILSSTIRFVFHTQFYPLAKWSFFSPLCSSPTHPRFTLPAFPLGSFQALFKARQVRSTDILFFVRLFCSFFSFFYPILAPSP